MKTAIKTAWFLWRHRKHLIEGYVTPIPATDPLSRGQRAGLRCQRCNWGHVLFLGAQTPMARG